MPGQQAVPLHVEDVGGGACVEYAQHVCNLPSCCGLGSNCSWLMRQGSSHLEEQSLCVKRALLPHSLHACAMRTFLFWVAAILATRMAWGSGSAPLPPPGSADVEEQEAEEREEGDMQMPLGGQMRAVLLGMGGCLAWARLGGISGPDISALVAP